jgi:tRNA(Ile)-lysidine synthase
VVTESKGSFSGDQLLETLARLPSPQTFWVGFSGGADSTALLAAMHELRPRFSPALRALHFHHGLQSEADQWLDHCVAFCAQREIPLTTEQLDIRADGRASLEEEARNCRYRSVERLIGQGDVYLTAHHADDQAETLFLNLMRGSGLEGLAGIPELRKLGVGWVGRPLLNTRRLELEAFLVERGIAWLEDPSNLDETYDRNHLRQSVFPMLELRWPGITQRLTRIARHARQSSKALADFLEQHSGHLFEDAHTLPLAPLLELEPALQSLVVRQWLRRQEIPNLPETRLGELLRQLSSSADSSQVEVTWGKWRLKRFRDAIWLQRQGSPPACSARKWGNNRCLNLGHELGYLEIEGADVVVPPGWRVDSRIEGERMRIRQEGPRRKLKHLFQESGIPPWLRACIPVLYWDNEAVALGDWLISPRLHSWLRHHGAHYRWHPDHLLLSKLQSDCHEFAVDPRQSLR